MVNVVEHPVSFRQAEQMRATSELAGMAVSLRDRDLPAVLRERAGLLLHDLFSVTLAGARTPELGRLARTFPGAPGPVRPIGSALSTTPETASFLDSVASCCLELDEGNKYAAGHPAAHVVFAAMAATRLSDGPVDGRQFVAAVVAGYEVAARFGRALDRDPGWHTHGHWGATGAATAAALVLGADARQVAAAIDASTSLIHVTPWPVVLEGGFVRNLWIAGANRAGLDAARLALAGLATDTGAAQHSLGHIVGRLDPERLTQGLGDEWLVLKGYLKRHASCAYTHAVVDAIQELRRDAAWDADDLSVIEVRTHHLVEPLLGTDAESRLGAMFSLPFVAAMACVAGAVDPDSMDPAGKHFGRARELSRRVRVEIDPHLDALLPHRRAAEVTLRLRDGSTLGVGVPNPVGDIDHLPLGPGEVIDKAARLVGDQDAKTILEVVGSLAASDDVASDLYLLP
jgi:2-methylcitrate dehydratase PrpD